MADPPVAEQGTHVAGPEDVTDQPRPLVQVERIAFRRGNPGCILAAMLQDHQAIVKQLVD